MPRSWLFQQCVMHTDLLPIRCVVTQRVHMIPNDAGQEDGQAAPAQYLVDLRCPGGQPALGRLDAPHLSDHPSGAAALRDALAAGSVLGPLLVLQRLEVRGCLGVVLWVLWGSGVCGLQQHWQSLFSIGHISVGGRARHWHVYDWTSVCVKAALPRLLMLCHLDTTQQHCHCPARCGTLGGLARHLQFFPCCAAKFHSSARSGRACCW